MTVDHLAAAEGVPEAAWKAGGEAAGFGFHRENCGGGNEDLLVCVPNVVLLEELKHALRFQTWIVLDAVNCGIQGADRVPNIRAPLHRWLVRDQVRRSEFV
jgi:hypothetical protein